MLRPTIFRTAVHHVKINKHLTTKNTVRRDCSKFSNLTISDFRVQHCREWNRCSLVCVAGGLSGGCS